MTVLLIDNYDSFVFNLARYFEELGQPVETVRNDAVTVAGVQKMKPAAIILSPGPGTPTSAGICVELVKQLAGCIPILGVCLGCQAVAQAFGARVTKSFKPVHGRFSMIYHQKTPLFQNIPNPFPAGRYHSLIVQADTVPPVLQVTAQTADGLVMAVEHCRFPVVGVQFHPESVLTLHGHQLLRNFLELVAQVECRPLQASQQEQLLPLPPVSKES